MGHAVQEAPQSFPAPTVTPLVRVMPRAPRHVAPQIMGRAVRMARYRFLLQRVTPLVRVMPRAPSHVTPQ